MVPELRICKNLRICRRLKIFFYLHAWILLFKICLQNDSLYDLSCSFGAGQENLQALQWVDTRPNCKFWTQPAFSTVRLHRVNFWWWSRKRKTIEKLLNVWRNPKNWLDLTEKNKKNLWVKVPRTGSWEPSLMFQWPIS